MEIDHELTSTDWLLAICQKLGATQYLSGPSGKEISMTLGLSGTVESEDYSLSSTTITFLPGEESKTITIQANDDLFDEFNKALNEN